ncbi:MAG: Gfo/Idh/MocA family oxidoreductase [Planctomycetes bacterium]|nr:Gfo/Idh/MocA family oxidoreductase [Planctomycetota bacterium]
MATQNTTRRQFIKQSSAFAGFAIWTGMSGRANGFIKPNQRPTIGAIGTGSRWSQRATGINGGYGSAQNFPRYGDIVAVCDADSQRVERAKDLVKGWTGRAPEAFADYRKIIENDKIDVVHISTPEHWHAKIAIEAMLAGKDVYCEKPMTLTIEEGQLMSKVCRTTGRIVQIGTQQRSDRRFIKAVAMIREGRLGELQKVTCSIGGAPTSPELPVAMAPKHLDWNQWLGPVPVAKYHLLAGARNEPKSWGRCQYEFRWWYEYSGGKLTDWGAHHVDIATWGMDKTGTGPVSIDPLMVEHPVPFKDGYPTVENRYNTATKFKIKVDYADGVELTIRHDMSNGILFEGTKGRIHVNRGRLVGKPVEDLEANPLPDGVFENVYKNRSLTNHFRNFFESVAAGKEPISDVFSHHRALTTCHLAGIAARLGRKIQWDPKNERIVGDEQAQSLVSRKPREGFETKI